MSTARQMYRQDSGALALVPAPIKNIHWEHALASWLRIIVDEGPLVGWGAYSRLYLTRTSEGIPQLYAVEDAHGASDHPH